MTNEGLEETFYAGLARRFAECRTLLHHSDCDGSIPWRKCRALADRMERLLPTLGQYDTATINWIKGLRLAYLLKQSVTFG